MGQFRSKLRSMLIDCYREGEFVLSSGKSDSSYYDLAPLFLSPNGLRVASIEVMSVLSKVEFDTLGCMELCPVPLVGAILIRTFADMRGFVVRKTRKGHGTNKLIEGNLHSDDKVAMLEDVTSTGQSVLAAIRAVEERGCKVACVLAIINRREGCDELLKDYNFKWLFTKDDLEV